MTTSDSKLIRQPKADVLPRQIALAEPLPLVVRLDEGNTSHSDPTPDQARISWQPVADEGPSTIQPSLREELGPELPSALTEEDEPSAIPAPLALVQDNHGPTELVEGGRYELHRAEDGRIRRIMPVHCSPGRLLGDTDPDVYSTDLRVIEDLIRTSLRVEGLSLYNAGFDLRRIRDAKLYEQDQIFDFATWLKIRAPELGISVSFAYRLINAADALDQLLVVTIQGTWGVSIDDLGRRFTKVSYLLTAHYRKVPLDTLREPFLVAPEPDFINLCTGRKPPTVKELETKREARRIKPLELAGPPLMISGEVEAKVVEALKLGLVPKFVSLDDPTDLRNLEFAVLATRRESAEKALKARAQAYLDARSSIKTYFQLHTLEDAERVFKEHLADGIHSRLILAVCTANLADDERLVVQWKARGYKRVHDYLKKALNVPFDTYDYLIIGRNYLRYEAEITSRFSVETEVMFTKLLLLDQAISLHGDQYELIWRYFSPEIGGTTWRVFATTADYEAVLKDKPLAPARVKEAKRLFFEYRTLLRAGEIKATTGLRTGKTVDVLNVINETEASLVELFLRNPKAMIPYIALYQTYKAKGLL
ncbi:MAG: hypothetical protein CVV47_16715 [Spirochaetae bacterium HGW-Spirochaetae-3]|jgi:hypothetical protein|nr:MAG: hypothetical protein CVV47_16715 [Spirochaetae bacterium HGW-Spirochaetae-3]